jgi:hypothetical protein
VELSYWIEEWDSAGKTARIWVKVPDIPSGGEAKITMHYGKPSASSSGNGDTTFDFFDDFEETSLNADKWLVQKLYSDETVHTIKWRSKDVIFQHSYSTVAAHTKPIPSNPLYIHFINMPEGPPDLSP